MNHTPSPTIGGPITNPRERTMFDKMRTLFPLVTPSESTANKFWLAFEQWDAEQEYLLDNQAWCDRMDRWLITNVGVMFDDPYDSPWRSFRVIDPRLYTMALLRLV